MTTLKSGNTSTVSWSYSWQTVLWLPLRTEVRVESAVWNSPVAGRTPLPEGGGDAGLGEAGLVGDIWRLLLFVEISQTADASESLSSVISRSQSDFPVEITIWPEQIILVSWHDIKGEGRRAHLAVVWLDRAQHVCVHVNVEAAGVCFMACYGPGERERYQITRRRPT